MAIEQAIPPLDAASAEAHKPRPFTPDCPDLSELRERHFRLQRERQDLATALRQQQEKFAAEQTSAPPRPATGESDRLVENLLPCAEALRVDACDAGQWIYDLTDRDAAQGIVDYWTSAIASIPGRSFPDLLTLAPPQPDCREQYTAHADAVMEELRSERDEELAGELLFSLDRQWGADLPLFLPPERLAALGSTQAQHVRQVLLDAGLVREVECADGAPATLALRHHPLLDQWGVFVTMRADAELAANKLKWLETYARNWARDRDGSSVLLRGKALNEAIELRDAASRVTNGHGLSAEACDFVRTSRSARNRQRLSAVVSAVIAVMVGLTVWWVAKDQLRLSTEKKVANARTEGQKQGVVEGQQAVLNTLPQAVEQVAQSAGAQPDQPNPRHDADIAMWIGSSTLPVLQDQAGNPLDPAQLQRGRYRARFDTWLRAGPPGPDYASRDTVAVLPARADVDVLRVLPAYNRPSGKQYWAEVQPATTVYIQYSRGTPERAAALRVQLAQAGFTMPDVQKVPVGRGQYEVRYAIAKDQALARKVMQALLENAPPGPASRPVCKLNPAGGRPSVFEIWIDLSAVATGTRGGSVAPPSCVDAAPRSPDPIANP